MSLSDYADRNAAAAAALATFDRETAAGASHAAAVSATFTTADSSTAALPGVASAVGVAVHRALDAYAADVAVRALVAAFARAGVPVRGVRS